MFKVGRGTFLPMKKSYSFFLIFLLAATSAFVYKKWNKIPERIAHRVPCATEKPIVVLTMAYNNSAFAKRNIDSVLSQKYTNFRWIYIDDASQDSTFECVKDLTKSVPNITLVKNRKNQGAMYNMYTAISQCKKEEIVVVLDADDWFLHDHVLAHVNEYFANDDVWLTYGQHIEYPNYKVGLCKPLGNKEPRTSKFLFSHLRCFYAGLFQKIKKEDLMKDGVFYKASCDVATMIPMLEMAGKHAFFVRELLHVYNTDNPLSDAKVRLPVQTGVEKYIRSLPKYKPVERL